MSLYLKHRFEYILLRGLARAVCILPLRPALGVGWLAAFFFFHSLRYRRDTAIRRIKTVFGDRFSPKERRQIAWISFRNLCFNAVEAARFHKLTPRQVHQMPLYSAICRAHELHRKHGKIIIASVHMGNWDLAGVAARLDGLPIFSIARRQKNPFTDELLNRMRSATGMEVVLNDSRVLQNVVRKLKQGGVPAILPDVRSHTEDLSLNFLGGRASLGAGAAFFAQAAGCPILPLVFTRQGWTRHDGKALAPIYPDPACDKKEDRRRIMKELIAVFDAEIQAHPEQYFWFNKRWVLDPVPGPAPVRQPEGRSSEE